MKGTWLVVGIIAAALAGGGAAALFLKDVSWPFVVAGWAMAALNAVAARAINHRAVGSPRQAFILWGILVNVGRMLTIAGIFAFIILLCEETRSGFLMSALVGIFVLMPIEVAGLYHAPAAEKGRTVT